MSCVVCAENVGSEFWEASGSRELQPNRDGLCWVCRRLRTSVRQEHRELVVNPQHCLVLAKASDEGEDDQ